MSVSVTYYIGSHGQNGQLFIGARDGHVLFVSGYPILTAVNSFKMGGVYSKCDIWHRLTCGCTDGRACLRCTQRFNQIFLHPQVSYPGFPRAEAPLLSWKWSNLQSTKFGLLALYIVTVVRFARICDTFLVATLLWRKWLTTKRLS